MKDTYHHGNLRVELIEKGLEYIDRYGVETLSMRKLADSVGVSSAAPYAHFKNKDAFLSAVRDYINEQFYNSLKETLDNTKDEKRILPELGKRYVMFFHENPLYYQFLFFSCNDRWDTNPSFVFFNDIAGEIISRSYKNKIDEKTLNAKVIALWSMVHGLSQIVNIEGKIDNDNLEEEIDRILYSVMV